MHVLDTIKAHLLSAGSRRWRGISEETGVAYSTLKKLAYNDLKNPGVTDICQPLLDYFEAVKRKQRKLPPPEPTKPRGGRRVTEGEVTAS